MSKNFTDPYVLHDPTVEIGKIATLYEPQDAFQVREDGAQSAYNDYDSERVTGVLHPVILVNNKVISKEQIIKFVLFYDNFAPSIILEVFDPAGSIQATDVPGLNNRIRVAIAPSVENTYKTIKLEFQIDDCRTKDDSVVYTGSYRLSQFMREYTKEIVYPGCSNKGENYSCNSSENKQPNTWEYLHAIAHDCGLGFMSTDECQTIEDRMPRLMSNEKYPEFINKHIQWGGVDENSIFDCWIDLYGYIVLVNLSWILKTEVDPKELKIFCASGIQSTEHIIPKQQAVEVDRVLTNYPYMERPTNMMFEYYNTIVDNSDLTFGTAMSQYQFNMIGVKDDNVNGVSQYDVRVVQNSADGVDISAYNSEKLKNIIIEFNEQNINKQKTIRSKFLSKHRQRKLEILLTRPNLGLQRGTLVNILIYETNTRIISEVGSQYDNINGPSTDTETTDLSVPEENISEKDVKFNENITIPNIFLSGLYYIDSMRFEYEKDKDDMKQFIILIKKGSLTNANNFSTMYRTNDPNVKEMVELKKEEIENNNKINQEIINQVSKENTI